MAVTKRKVKDYSADGIDLSRLTAAMRTSRMVLKRFREERTEAVRKYVGIHWSENGAADKQPINLIHNYVSVVGKSLIAKNPRVMLSVMKGEHKPVVSAMQDWCNKQIQKVEFANTEQRIVHDSLFSLGIGKVCLASPAMSSLTGWNVSAGEPSAMRVDLDDFVYDVHARDFTEVGYIGHRYRVPIDVVKDSKIYNKSRKKLQPSTDSSYNAQGDERISMLGRTYYASNDEEYEDFVELWELYLPRHRRVITLAADSMGEGEYEWDEPLLDQPWIGPYCGPYYPLGMGTVPGNAMPLAPIMNLIDLHDATNRLWRKIIRQGERQKEVLMVAGGALEDGSRIQQAKDGDIIRNDNPAMAQAMSFGSPNQANFQLAQELQKKFSGQAGNLDLLSGTGPQAKTATQDKLLNENAGRQVEDMQQTVVKHTSDMLKALCWYWHHDPRNVMKTEWSLPGNTGISIERQVTPPDRQQVSFEDMEIRVDPYSLQYQSPQMRLQMLNQTIQTIVLPMMPILQQQGVSFDVQAYLAKVAEYGDMPDLPEIVKYVAPPETDAPTGEMSMKPGETTRNYVRKSEAGSQADQQNDLSNDLSAGATQDQSNQPMTRA